MPTPAPAPAPTSSPAAPSAPRAPHASTARPAGGGDVADLLAAYRPGTSTWFSAGGRHLLATGTRTRIASSGGAGPALHALADGRDGAAGADGHQEALVVLRAEGAAEPVFCLHPAGGTAWPFAGLAEQLPAGRPVLALQFTGPAPADLAALVERYAALVRARQPRGPYHLLGYSFGGSLVPALAQRLLEAGEQVAAAVVLDAPPAGSRAGGAGGAHAHVHDHDHDHDGGGAAERRSADPAWPPAVQRSWAHCLRLLDGAQPADYRGALTVVTAAAHHDELATAWVRAHRGPLVLTPVPLEHDAMVTREGWTALVPLLADALAVRTPDGPTTTTDGGRERGER